MPAAARYPLPNRGSGALKNQHARQKPSPAKAAITSRFTRTPANMDARPAIPTKRNN
jgi:hypothetical protein